MTDGGLVLVPVQRLGVPGVLVQPGQRLGHACDVVYAPVAVLCGRTLRSRHPLMVIPGGDHLASWQRAGHVCADCLLALAHVGHTR